MSETNQAHDEQGTPGGEVHAFQTEMQQLLQILVHSLYAEREVFLRELISNAADALNKLNFRLQTDRNVRDAETEPEITLEVDSEGKALVVGDTGVGMTREELIENLGTIAHSGTLDFVKQLSAADPQQRADLIGQFGVGFYSVFMVARRVVVDTCPADPGEAPCRWVSEGHGEFTVLPGERQRRGTSVRVELKEDAEEFCQPDRLEAVVRRYSNFIPHPIRLDGRRLNVQQAIWTQPRSEVSEEDYTEFYKFLTHDAEAPLHTLHLAIDAPVQYRALLFIPPQLTNEVLYSPHAHGLSLYANKVLIQQDHKELLPLYLRFLRGVVDTEDLPLNVSRETVQHNPLLTRLRNSLTGRVLRELKQLAEQDDERYTRFWLQYGKVLKEGIPQDESNKERLLELARFNSSACESAEALTTLDAYVERMKEGQEEILYFTGPSRDAIERNPHLEFFRRRGYEVLYLYDQVDDFVMAQLPDYKGKTVASIDQADLKALQAEEGEDTEAEQRGEALAGETLDGLVGYLKRALGERVQDVAPSRRLVDSPAVLTSADGLPGNLAKIMKTLNQDFQSMPKKLEINPAHPLVRSMGRIHAARPDDPTLGVLAEQLFDNCLLVEGLVEHPERMMERIQTLMQTAAELHAGSVSGGAGDDGDAATGEPAEAAEPVEAAPAAETEAGAGEQAADEPATGEKPAGEQA